MARILVIEDEHDTARVMKEWLISNSHSVDIAVDLSNAVARLTAADFDLIVLDLNLPDADGVELLQQLRNQGQNIPIMVVTGRNTIESKVRCFDIGADDYLTKPFHFREMVSRIQVLLRRNIGISSNILRVNETTINLSTKMVTNGATEVKLSNHEYAVCLFFMTHPDMICSSKELVEQVWKDPSASSDAVRSCIKRLRQRLGEGFPLETLSTGYRLNTKQ